MVPPWIHPTPSSERGFRHFYQRPLEPPPEDCPPPKPEEELEEESEEELDPWKDLDSSEELDSEGLSSRGVERVKELRCEQLTHSSSMRTSPPLE